MSVDKETQMTPQKANTPLRETMTKKTEGTVIQSVKTGSKKKRKRKFVEYDKARLHLPELGMTEEEMLRRGPMCKTVIKGILDKCVHVTNVDGYTYIMVA